MVDLLVRWPVRLALLGAVTAATVVGDCGRPIYLGHGGLTAAVPVTPAPSYRGRDTTATYVTGFASPRSFTYNARDANQLAGAYVHRAWVSPNHTLTAGLVGYRGSYTLGVPDERRSIEAAYSGLGGTVGWHYHTGSRGVETRPLVVQLTTMREWGQWLEVRRHPDAYWPHHSTNNMGASPWQTTLNLGMEAQTRPRRRGWPVVGAGFGINLPFDVDVGSYGRVWLSKGPVWLHGQIQGGSNFQEGGAYQFGVTVALPPYGPKRR